jgi:hypothetical protein
MESVGDPHAGQDPRRVPVEAAKLGANLVLAEAAGRCGSVGRFESAVGAFRSPSAFGPSAFTPTASLRMSSHDTLTGEA